MERPKVEIRRAEPEDYVSVYEIYSAPSAYAGTLQLPFPSLETWRQRLQHPEDGVYNLAGIVEGRLVGMLTIVTFPSKPRRRHAGFVGMGVHDSWQGRGVGSTLMLAACGMADRWLALTRLELEVFTDNEPAVRLYERFGFEREGTMREYAYRDGKLVDAYMMARVKPAEGA